MANSMRDKMRQKLKDKTKESHGRRDSSGITNSFFDPEKMKNVKTWWASKGEHIIDIIPYIAGSNDPYNEKGDPTYVLDLEVHRNIGPKEEMVVCLAQFGKTCPICMEARRRSREGADYKTDIKPLKPSRRAVYNVIVRDGGQMEKKGVQVFEIAHWFMEKHLSKIAKDPRSNGYIVFSDPDEGRSVSFERTGAGRENTNYDGHRFIDRIDPITDEELDQAYCLDDLIKIHTEDEIKAIMGGSSSTEPSEPSDSDNVHDASAVPAETVTLSKKDKKKLKKFRKLECPGSGTIGQDFEEFDKCSKCKIYDKCEFVAAYSE